MIKNKNIIFIGEFLGSCFLVMIIVGSGIMAENLTDDNAVRLLANTIATGAGLFVLIISFADISCLLYTSPSPRDAIPSRMPSSA